MIISFKNINGGGGGGYVLPTATPTRLGGVKIGNGINVDSAGTISVSGGPIHSKLLSKSMDAHERAYSNEIEFNFMSTDEYSYTFNPYLRIIQFNNIDWSPGSYLDIILEKANGAEYPTFKLVNCYNKSGFHQDVLVEETLDFNINVVPVSGVNVASFNVMDFVIYGWAGSYDGVQYDTIDYTVKGLKVKITSDGFNAKLSLLIDSNEDQTFLNYLVCPDNVYDFNSNVEVYSLTTTGQYPLATEGNLGLVKIGNGINIAEDGTISVSGGGGGIEVVTELPASGTDGQMVMLINSNEGGEEIIVRGDTSNIEISATAKSITEKTKLWTFQHSNDRVDINANSDGTIEANSTWHQTTYTFSGSGTFMMDDVEYGGGTVEVTVTKVAEGEWLFTCESPVERYDIHSDVIPPATEYKLYKWSDEKTPSIDAVISNDGYMVEIFYDEIPAYTESAFTVVKVSIMEEAPKVEVEYRNGNFYNMEDQNTPLIADGQIHIGAYDNTSYLISDGYIKFISNNGAIKFVDTDIWNGQMNVTGWTEYGRNGVVYSGKNCYMDFPIKFNGNSPIYNNTNIYVPTSIGTNGQILKTNGEGVYWGDLVIPKTEIYQSLPYCGNEGDLVLTNSEYFLTTASTFIAMNSTSESDKNNFSNDNELGWYDLGESNYIYFGNASAYTNTKDTFLYRIAMRTNENGDWNTSELAYINVIKAGNAYEIFMDNFNYYDTGGTPVPYTFTMLLSSTGTTSGNTPYLPLWKYLDGGFGYKFHFEVDQDNNLKMWMKHSYADSEYQDPDYVQGQNYGDMAVKCMDHTEVFYDYINLDQDDTHLSIYKGGVWYELGYLTRQGV